MAPQDIKVTKFAERYMQREKMDKKGTLLMNRTLLSENTLATVFNESAIPAAEVKTRFKFFSFFFFLWIG